MWFYDFKFPDPVNTRWWWRITFNSWQRWDQNAKKILKVDRNNRLSRLSPGGALPTPKMVWLRHKLLVT